MRIDTILLIPQKSDEERESVLSAWTSLGGKGQKLDKFWEKPADLDNKKVAVYGNDTFALVLAEIFKLKLISPDDSLIARLDRKWTKRTITEKQIYEATETDLPKFIKPATPKQFKGKVYDTIEEFRQETNGLLLTEKVLLSDIITVDTEARAFVLNRQLQDIAIYEGEADLQAAKKFLLEFLEDQTFDLPKTFVVDIGRNSEQGWFIIEFNSSWGAGLNNCDPKKVLESILEATQ